MDEQPTPAPPPAPEAYTTPAELAARLGISRQTLYAHIKSQAVAAVAGEPHWLPTPSKLAGRLVWLTADLDGIEHAERPRPGNPTWVKRAEPTPADEPAQPST